MKPTSTAEVRRFLNRKASALGIPVSGIFELTPRCNLKCKMCYVRLTPEQMTHIGTERTADEWLNIGKQCADEGMAFLLITGGEPTIRTDFPKIYEGLTKLGLSISINTNGTLLTPELKELWHRLPPAQVNITLYGVCPEDYKNLCDNGDAFNKVIDTLDWLKNEGILVHLNTTIVPTNYSKWLELEKFAVNKGLELRATTYCFPPTRRGCNECKSFERISPEEAGDLLARDLHFRLGDSAILTRAEDLSLPVQKSCEIENGEPIQCQAGRSQFWMTWYGAMTLCGMIDKPATLPFEYGFAEAWQQLRSLSQAIRLCSVCNNCPEQKSCMNCAAVTYAETGRFDGKPEYMCKLNRSYRETIVKLAKEIRQKS